MGKKLDKALEQVQNTPYSLPYARDERDIELRQDPKVNGPFLDEVQTGHEDARRSGKSVKHLLSEGEDEQKFRARETKGDRDAANPEVRRAAQKKSDARAQREAKKKTGTKSTTKKTAAKKATVKKTASKPGNARADRNK